MLTFGSLFAGIGGFDLGLERAGMECAWQVDNNDYCLKVLAKHWPDVKRYRDVREVGEHNLEPVDLICGGFPCQPYSVAGKRRGAEDDRNLWPEFLRVVREVRPTWVVGENVPGIVPMYLDQVLSDLEGEAYTCWPFNIPACAFDAPHRRERIFVIAYSSIAREGRLHIRSRGSQQATIDIDGNSEDVAYAEPVRRGEMEQPIIAGTNGKGTANKIANRSISTRGIWWAAEPGICRVVDGVSHRMDRLRGIGNALVPQVAEFIGRRIIDADADKSKADERKSS